MSWHPSAGMPSSKGWGRGRRARCPGWEHGTLCRPARSGESAVSRSVTVSFVVVPLSGSVVVTSEDTQGTHEAALAGRPSVFAGPTDVAYCPGLPGSR